MATGLGANRHWLPDGFCEQLTEHGFAVARYDQRDGGESTHLPPTAVRNPITALLTRRGADYTAEDVADDAVAVLDELGWHSAHVLGVSLGGAVVQRLTLRHPHRVRTLTSVDAVPGDVTGLRTLRYIRLRTLAKFARVEFPDTRDGAIEAGVMVAKLLASPRHEFDEAAVRARLEAEPDSGIHDARAQSRQIGARWSGPAITEISRPPGRARRGRPPDRFRRRAHHRVPHTRLSPAHTSRNRARPARTRVEAARYRNPRAGGRQPTMNSAEFRRAMLRTRDEMPAVAALPLADVRKTRTDRALVLEPSAGHGAGTRCVGVRAARQCVIVGTPMDIPAARTTAHPDVRYRPEVR
ncbi:alpha/beta fold hydrolase [Nocardia sp. NPDC050799]|uniref:alpha/beta fold hydrolase n=1 Tax=Nocardia sp. NPDC050799 TaxID=3154842 RepID=UPI0033CCEFCE